ncbi:DUF2141 domain-containing protein [Glaciecola sp. MH2013]|uniref:DUF2141 domain-containing protein n=1 Tax=Glaciecola sp. MH2013 TaxID=2785524 RepID=UPI0018A0AC39|nr:DUF2141 domain-containing protein [Glaciecola sp. MH2013]MBF7073576.1 DUF2141 domain-containing protein [Glaciecola sp. MH2013]
MKTLNTLVRTTLLASTLTLAAFASQASELEVNFINIDRPVGQLLVAIYDSEQAYTEKATPLRWAKAEAVGDTVTMSFDDLEDGTYALMLIHDINSNGKMDINAMGLPQDGYGFSNNVGMYGLPPFEAASFEVKEYASIDVVVRKPVNL